MSEAERIDALEKRVTELRSLVTVLLDTVKIHTASLGVIEKALRRAEGGDKKMRGPGRVQ